MKYSKSKVGARCTCPTISGHMQYAPTPNPKQLIVSLPAKRRKDLDIIFLRREKGFNGADADFSLPIGRGRSLWLFGDTLVGPRFNPPKYEMPRNAIGILHHNAKAKFVVPALAGKTNPTVGADLFVCPLYRANTQVRPYKNSFPTDSLKKERLPDPSTLKFTFHWRTENRRARAFFPAPKAGQWLWPGSACVVNQKIYYFLHAFQTDNKNSKYDSFKFRRTGFRILRTDNPDDTPDNWNIEHINIPKLCDSVVWGISCFSGKDSFLYLWGATRGHRKKGTVMARCPFEFLEENKGKGWEFFVEGKSSPVWSYQSNYLHPLFSHRAPEMSLHYLEKQKIFLTVYGFHKDKSLGLRIARNIEGPWSHYQEFYRPPERDWNKHYFSYAPKAHPELSPDGNELFITYISNSLYPRDVFIDKRIYYPKFLALKLK